MPTRPERLRRPRNMSEFIFDLKTAAFSGPLEKLLELVEERKLPITEVSLAEVTNDFLDYLRTLETVDPSVLADFIVVASRLILIKSKALVPELTLTPEEEGEIKDLERRLALYKEIREGMKHIAKLWKGREHAHGRQYFMLKRLAVREGVFYPGANLNIEAMLRALQALAESIHRSELETDTVRGQVVSVEEKIKEIIGRLAKGGGTTLSALSETKPRSEVIAIFLALLYLAREQMILLEQSHYFSDIMITSAPR